MSLKQKIQKFWYFKVKNPVVQKGEGRGFKYVFRRFDMTIETVSGNWKMRVRADEHPYCYLLSGCKRGDITNLLGFAETMYFLNATLTREQALVDDVQKALRKYEKRLMKTESAPDDAEEEALAMAEVKGVQEYVEASPKERRKMDRETNGRFKKAVKEVEAQNLQGKE